MFGQIFKVKLQNGGKTKLHFSLPFTSKVMNNLIKSQYAFYEVMFINIFINPIIIVILF